MPIGTTRRLTLVQQNDTHAQTELHWEAFWHGGRLEHRRVGGLARAAAVVQRIREEAPSTLFVDCGDTIHGTLPAIATEGRALVAPLNALGLEAMTPGNWEYAYGPDVLKERAADLAFPLLACNVQEAASGERLFPPFVVREVEGLRVGLLGITSPIIPQMSAAYAAGLRFPDVHSRIPTCITRLRVEEDCDLVVALSHLGFAQDVALAREVEGLDVILSGHTHNRLDRPARVGRTLIIQSGFSGSFLGRLDLEVDRGTVVDYDHALIALDEEIEPDAEVQALVDDALAPFREELDEVVGRTRTPLHRMGLLETTTDNLITDAYLALTGCDVALSHGWRYGPPVPPGPVTLGDLWAMIPTNPEVATAEVTGEELRVMLEQNMHHVFAGDAFEQAGGYLVRVSGMSVVFRPNNGRGTRVEHLDVRGERVVPDRLYTVALAGERQLRRARNRQGTGVRAIDALRRYFAAHDAVEAPLTGAKFVAQ